MQYFTNSLGHGILFQDQDVDGLEFPEYPTGKVGVGIVSEKGEGGSSSGLRNKQGPDVTVTLPFRGDPQK